MSASDPKRTSAVRQMGSPAGSACYFLIIVVIRHETTAAARWALLLIVRTLSNDAITVAIWTGFGFHVCLPVDVLASLTRQPNVMHRGLFPADEPVSRSQSAPYTPIMGPSGRKLPFRPSTGE
jgi:hypothetical protein